MRFSYYPGCSAHSTAREYDSSTRAVCRSLGIELDELADWNCCGSSSASHTNHRLSAALSLRNLILADARDADLATICAFCFNRLRSAQKRIGEEPDVRREVEQIAGAPYQGKVEVRHLLDILFNDVGLAALRERVTRPLTGMSAVAYYGCLLVRPRDIAGFDDPEHPVVMDRILRAIGVECLEWSYKTECCGASLSITRPDVVTRLVRNLFQRAEETGAQCVVTACPLCFSNLETRTNGRGLPVFYFTELLGLAFGATEAKQWFGKHLIPVPELARA
ncbi:MAG: CoB--CoM heterodisulfide reductase iron-sulfur subunit B family protein [Chloroflexota bacterium]|nr:CoB--CoM heterodisulfide reductase iron-sulfur subunit B family protein [Chloroflexota bacterium]